jgi:hypothetical protein
VQLVILEPNETLDTDEIKFADLTKLKLMYPSVTSDVSPEVAIFEKNIRKANNIFRDYTQWFDTVLITMIRLVQNKSFEKPNSAATKRGRNGFECAKKTAGDYINKTFYFLLL